MCPGDDKKQDFGSSETPSQEDEQESQSFLTEQQRRMAEQQDLEEIRELQQAGAHRLVGMLTSNWPDDLREKAGLPQLGQGEDNSETPSQEDEQESQSFLTEQQKQWALQDAREEIQALLPVVPGMVAQLTANWTPEEREAVGLPPNSSQEQNPEQDNTREEPSPSMWHVY